MFKLIIGTKKYRKFALYETEKVSIQYIENKENREYDRIRIVRYGDRYSDAQEFIIFRYEDEQFVNHMVETFRNQEETENG